jgi:hypothetical protein
MPDQRVTEDPQFTTQGAYREAEAQLPGPQEGQRGTPRKKTPPRARRRRQSLAARRGEDETSRKTGLGEKAKNPRQLRKPGERKKRQLGPAGRARSGVARRPKGRSRTLAGVLQASSGLERRIKASPMAKRRVANRGKRPKAAGAEKKRKGGGRGGRNLPP